MEKGQYYESKIQERESNGSFKYNAELQECVEKTCSYCIATANSEDNEEKKNHPIMMLGKIQSGKTRAFIGLIALGFDNGFDMALILTKNSKALVDQTRKRMRSEFREAISNNDVDVFDIIKMNDGLTDYELDKKIIIVAKKEKTNLDRISKFISKYTIEQRKNCLIIDDEADTTGIGFEKVKDTEDEFDLRRVSSKVNEIRGSLDGCVFVQVTATPYALYLQPEFVATDEIKPIKPKKTFLVPSGDGYIGGEYYFLLSKENNHPGRFIFEAVSEAENELVSDQKRNGKKSKIDDRRSFKVEDILIRQDRLMAFKKGIINFIVGGSCLRQLNPNSHYSYIIHTATQKSSHFRLEEIAQMFISEIKNRNTSTQPIIDELLQDAYEDIERSYTAYGYKMPDYGILEEAFYKAIDKGYIKITTVNSDKDMQEILDEDNGELRLAAPFSIFVGGQILDRGVTIPKMIGFYYGRNPYTMQQDTVMQHSRMFGYRSDELLSVTRFYTTTRIYENMVKITEMDEALRETIERDGDEGGVYFLQQYCGSREDENGTRLKDKVIPCSPAKIAMSNIVMFKGQSRILPIGFTPVAASYGRANTKSINKLLEKLIKEDNKDAVKVSYTEVCPIIEKVYQGINQDDDSARFVSKERFLSTLGYLCGKSGEVYLIVRRNRKLSKFKSGNSIYQDSPDTPQDERSIAKKVAKDIPALMLIHQDGTGEGWNGCEFWWPVISVQQNVKMTIFALPDPDGKIKR